MPLQHGVCFFYHLFSAPSSASLASRLPMGEDTELLRSACNTNDGLDSITTPVAQHPRSYTYLVRILATCLLARAYQHIWPFRIYDVFKWFTYISHTVSSSPRFFWC